MRTSELSRPTKARTSLAVPCEIAAGRGGVTSRLAAADELIEAVVGTENNPGGTRYVSAMHFSRGTYGRRRHLGGGCHGPRGKEMADFGSIACAGLWRIAERHLVETAAYSS